MDRRSGMRGEKQDQVSVTCLIHVETMIPSDHPIRTIKRLLNEVLAQMDAHFDEIYAANGRPSIPPERLLLAKVLMALYSIRSERFCGVFAVSADTAAPAGVTPAPFLAVQRTAAPCARGWC